MIFDDQRDSESMGSGGFKITISAFIGTYKFTQTSGASIKPGIAVYQTLEDGNNRRTN